MSEPIECTLSCVFVGANRESSRSAAGAEHGTEESQCDKCNASLTLSNQPNCYVHTLLRSNGTLGAIDVCTYSTQQSRTPIMPPLSSRVLRESSPPVNRTHLVGGGGVRYTHFTSDPVRNKFLNACDVPGAQKVFDIHNNSIHPCSIYLGLTVNFLPVNKL